MFPLARAVATLVLVFLSAPAHSGAWPREPGGVFLSLKSEYETVSEKFRTSIYGEFGLTRRITLGFQASDGPPDEAKQEEYEWQRDHGDALLLTPPSRRRVGGFVNMAIGPLDATNRFAISLGASAPPDEYGMMMEYRIEAAAHWGRGFESGWGDGWMTATAKVIHARDEDELITDFFGLIGLKPREDWMTMLSLGRYTDMTGTTWKLSPSIGYRPHRLVWVVPSIAHGFGDGDAETSIGLGLWLSF